jgi:hypothetical protein
MTDMVEKFFDRACVGLLALTLVLAGPVAFGLALTEGNPPAEVVETSQLLLVQDTPATTPVGGSGATTAPPAAAEAQDAVPVTPQQEVVIEWGNWVQTLLKPIKDAIYVVLPVAAWLIIRQIPAWMQIFLPRQRINDLLLSAAQSALAGVENAAKGKKLTIPVTNDVIRQMAVYIISTTAPDLAKAAAANLPVLLQKALFALPVFAEIPPGYSLEEAVKSVTKESIKKTAQAQGVSPDPFNRYFGT